MSNINKPICNATCASNGQRCSKSANPLYGNMFCGTHKGLYQGPAAPAAPVAQAYAAHAVYAAPVAPVQVAAPAAPAQNAQTAALAAFVAAFQQNNTGAGASTSTASTSSDTPSASTHEINALIDGVKDVKDETNVIRTQMDMIIQLLQGLTVAVMQK